MNKVTILMQCPHCKSYPVSEIQQLGRVNEGEKEKYRCEICIRDDDQT